MVLAGRRDSDETWVKGPDSGKELVHDQLVVTAYMSEQIRQHNTVYAAVRMIADCNERTFRQMLQHLAAVYCI